MSATTPRHPAESTHREARENRAAQKPEPVRRDSFKPPNSLADLDSLFCTRSVDLKRVSDAIRLRPALEALVLRLTDSLGLSSERPVANVEAAAVVLGRDRLRVLLHTWVVLEGAREKPVATQRETLGFATATGRESRSSDSVMRWTPETLYLSTFLHWFGLQGQAFPGSLSNACDDLEMANATATELVRAQRRPPGWSVSPIVEYVSGMFARSLSAGSTDFHNSLLNLAAAHHGKQASEIASRTGDQHAEQISRELSGYLSGLAEVLERDFVALLPYLEATAAQPQQKAAAVGGERSLGEKRNEGFQRGGR